MNLVSSRFPLLAVSVVVVLLLAGCGGQTIVRTVTAGGPLTSAATSQQASSSTASSQTATAAPAASSETTSASRSATRQAAIGETLKLRGSGGLTVDVTVDAVLDPLSVGQYDQADAGQRFIGVQVTLQNVGSVPYSDSPSNGATLLSRSDEQATSEIVTGGPCGNGFQSSAKIAPGDTQQGCLPFELPVNETAGTFQFTLDSGFADQTGQWSLARGDHPAATASTPTTTAVTAAPSTTPSTTAPVAVAGVGPVGAVKAYWADIGSHGFGAAFLYLAPGTLGQTKSQFVAGEKQAGIQAVAFTGRIASENAADATVDVDSLITHDHQFGCRSWSGSYDLVSNEGQWQIQKARITPSPCG
jgi:hypothetical protein